MNKIFMNTKQSIAILFLALGMQNCYAMQAGGDPRWEVTLAVQTKQEQTCEICWQPIENKSSELPHVGCDRLFHVNCVKLKSKIDKEVRCPGCDTKIQAPSLLKKLTGKKLVMLAAATAITTGAVYSYCTYGKEEDQVDSGANMQTQNTAKALTGSLLPLLQTQLGRASSAIAQKALCTWDCLKMRLIGGKYEDLMISLQKQNCTLVAGQERLLAKAFNDAVDSDNLSLAKTILDKMAYQGEPLGYYQHPKSLEMAQLLIENNIIVKEYQWSEAFSYGSNNKKWDLVDFAMDKINPKNFIYHFRQVFRMAIYDEKWDIMKKILNMCPLIDEQALNCAFNYAVRQDNLDIVKTIFQYALLNIKNMKFEIDYSGRWHNIHRIKSDSMRTFLFDDQNRNL